jgi:hypothetical protein
VTRRLVVLLPIVLVAVGVAGVALTAARGTQDPDMWWHLRLGTDFLQQGNLRAPAHWSSLATQSWVPTEALPEVVAAKAEQWAGFDGVMWLYGVACMAVLLALYAGNRAVSGALPASLATLLGLLGCYESMTPRPQLLSFALLAIVLRAWNRTGEDLQPRWYLIPLIFGWSLCHGFWFIGAAYGFVEVLGLTLDRRIRPREHPGLFALPVVATAVVLLNPIGLGVFEAPFAVNDVVHYVKEWDHPTPTATPVIVALVMAVVVLVLWSRDRSLWSWRSALLLVSALFWTWYAWRTVALASIVLAPLFAQALDALLKRSASEEDPGPDPLSTRREIGVLAAWTAACVVALAALAPLTVQTPTTNSAIDRSLDQMPAGSVVLNSYGIGGWLTWRHPDLNQAIDGLITPYRLSYVNAFFNARDVDPGWQEFVDGIGANVALLAHDAPLARALERTGWTIRARSTDYLLLQRPQVARNS